MPRMMLTKVQFGTDCGACHTTDGWLPASFDHALTQVPAQRRACSSWTVHNATPMPSLAACRPTVFRAMPRMMPTQVSLGPPASACHTTDAWLPATFDHSLTQFPLSGAHASLECSECHKNEVFTNLPADCASCHPDPSFHAGLFAGMTCDQCHSTAAWSPASFNLSHPDSCGEERCIGHEDATCRDCHNTNLSTATCLKCHDSNNPSDGDGGGRGRCKACQQTDKCERKRTAGNWFLLRRLPGPAAKGLADSADCCRGVLELVTCYAP